MDPERWREIERIYNLALEQPADRRSTFLEQICAGDYELRQEVESLLAHAEGAEEFVNAAAQAIAGMPGDSAGMAIGRYSLLQKIAEGGMGEVWLAEQKDPVRRRVALKLVKAGMNTREVIARFESERQALALMDHPAIAKVFDAGSTSQGAPYFVMEYVSGVAITQYCDHHRLTINERLELFMHVCEGVRHAHQKAIIHRDLKPSNILVAELDGRAAPKIIDFGVAKALGQKLTTDTLFTRVGALVGTAEYMSPEQAVSSGEDIDTRTDVYSLGVIFYELLAGVPPIQLRKIAFEEFLRSLREEEPPKPSTKIRSQDAVTATDVGRNRHSEPVALVRQIRGDLDSIALKALEKDRSRRYGSASEFAADIGRYLRNEAVLAVPPSAAYHARKFARRYRAPLITASAFALVLILAAVISIRQSLRANREAAVAQAVNDFLQNDLLAQASAYNQSGPGAKPDRDLRVRTALDRAAARIAGKFDRQPEVEAAIRDTIGRTYLDLGLYPEARTQLQRALEVESRVLGPKNPKTLQTMRSLGWLALLEGKYPQAEALLTQALQISSREFGSEHRDTLSAMSQLANVYDRQGKYPQAEALHSKSLEIQRRVLGPEHPETLASMTNLAGVYYSQGKNEQAAALYSQALEPERRVLGPEHPVTVQSISNLASVYYWLGKHAQAEALYSQLLEIQRRVLGPEHPQTLFAMSGLASAEAYQGKYTAAEALYDQTLEIQRRVLGSEHPETILSMSSLADVYRAQCRYAQADALYRQTLEMQRRVLGPEHPDTLSTLSGFAFSCLRQGKYALAETYAARALTGRQHALGVDHPDTIDSVADLSLVFSTEGKFAQSEPLARQAVEFDRKQRPDDWPRFFAESLLGASLAGQKKYAEAQPLLLEGARGMVARKDRIAVPDRDWIVQLYQASGQPKEAAEWRK